MTRSTTTASARVAQALREDIASGRLKVGDRLPTRRQICETYGIAAMTAARVVRLLVEEGLAVSDVGRGVFVTKVPETSPTPPANDGDRLGMLEERVQRIEERLAELDRGPLD